nr:immunoglobulin light chain junction region [Macaca mulatta]MPO04390.1 immunoglobulin light chain junction region [Macaca mulatta]MPO04905.1 immunoglobulin light chain junction region [Macaca mulatta]MPO05084.1 immunoglobulin light chain junction region [Macaca mulatta]MPO05270.1 immunoglobulin light chain junction region [Macaca mulatta]
CTLYMGSGIGSF